MVAAQSSGQEIRSIKDMEYWHVNTITILLSFSLEPGDECSIALEYQGPVAGAREVVPISSIQSVGSIRLCG